MVNAPPYGFVTKFFFLTPSGLMFLERYRLKARALSAIRKGIQQAKRDIEQWLFHYWARDTGKLVRSMVKFLNRNVFNDLSTPFKIAIGSDIDYYQWVIKMTNVNWTNQNTVEIEGSPEYKMMDYIYKSLRMYIPIALDEAGLGWMVGRGALPKQITIEYTSGMKKVVPRYRGSGRILQWV